MGAATMTATAMTMGVAPTPTASAAVSVDIPPDDPIISAELPVGLYTTGLPFRILDLLGQSIIPDLPVDIDVIQFLSALDPKTFYNTVNATPNEATVTLNIPGIDPIVLDVDTYLRVIGIVSWGFASYTTMDTYRKLAASTAGEELPAGYTPVEQTGRGAIIEVLGLRAAQLPSLPNLTILALVLIRDPGRPNGGIGARFAPVFSLFGIDTVTPDVEPVLPPGFNLLEPVVAVPFGQSFYPGGPTCNNPITGCVGTTWQGGAALLPIHVNVGWEYDPISDFPATANPFSIANSLMAGIFPTYILREPDLDGLAAQVADVAVGDILGALVPGADEEDVKDALNIYLTLGSGALPLLEPQRLLVDVINLFTGLGLGTPISDSIEPALKILVNIGYTDVVTPQDILDGTAPAGAEPYSRTLDDDSMATPTPFLSPTLTLDEYLQVPQDVIEALIDGFAETFGNGYQIFDPARRNALATVLNALGVSLPSLNLGQTLQDVVPDLSSTFATQNLDDTDDLAPTAFSSGEGGDDDGADLRLVGDDNVSNDDGDDEQSEDNDEGGDDTTSANPDEGNDRRPGLFRPRGTVLGGIRDLASNVLGVDRGDQNDEDGNDESTDATTTVTDQDTNDGDADGGTDGAGAVDAA